MSSTPRNLIPWLHMFILMSMAALPAAAADVQWTINSGTFTDGGTVSGTFTYDAATHLATNWSLTVTGGNTGFFPPLVYTPANSTFGYSTGIGGTSQVLIFMNGVSPTR